MLSFENQHALVTGGTRGIGAAIAKRLANLGASVTITGRSETAPENTPDSFGYVQADFATQDGIHQAMERLAKLERVTIIVNNAGINAIHRVEDFPEDEFDRITQVNYSSVYKLTQWAAKHMIANQIEGRIVNIASIWATNTRIGRSAYCSAKAGLLGMTRSTSADLAEHNILVNAVSPGFTRTELTESTMGPEVIKEVSAQIPIGRLAEPSEIAEVVAFLASPQNTYLTGQNIVVDGGFTNV